MNFLWTKITQQTYFTITQQTVEWTHKRFSQNNPSWLENNYITQKQADILNY